MLARAFSAIYVIWPGLLYAIIVRRMSAIIPFNRLIGIELKAVEDGLGRAVLPYRPDLLNHIGTVHATAIFGLAEAASGCALAGIFAQVLSDVRPVATSSNISYLRKATTQLSALAKVVEPASELRSRLESERKVRFTVEVAVTDETGSDIASVTVEWQVSLRG